jgi:DNA-binding Lrp family transcriptional regulator
MVIIDLKDRKILYQLDIDSKQSLSKIGKKIGLPKTVVAYRIKKLKESGIIKNYYTVINAFKLGYNIFRFYLTYQYTNPELKKEIVDYFIKSKHSIIVHSVEGNYDLIIFIAVKNENLAEFYNFWQATLEKYRDNFANQVFSLYLQERTYGHLFLLDEKISRTKFKSLGVGKRANIDDIDYQILKSVAVFPDTGISISEIAKNLNLTSDAVNYRIKKLMKIDVIRGFRAGIDFSKLGYRLYKVDIFLKYFKDISKIMRYLEDKPNFSCRDITLGHADLELELFLKNVDELHTFMDDLSTKFPDMIKSYKYFSHVKSHKFRYIPDF